MTVQSEKVILASGQEINLISWQGETSSEQAVLYLHGVESHSEWFSRTAKSLVEAGISVYGFDRSGWGRSSGRRGHMPSPDVALEELEQIRSIVASRHSTVHFVGMSWGGLLALYYALRFPGKVDSLTLIAPGIIPRRDLSIADKVHVVVGGILGTPWNVQLYLRPTDFTFSSQWQDYIAGDEHRITKVSPSFCLSTFQMRRYVTRALRKGAELPPTNVLLAEHDAVINNWATIELLQHAQIRIISYEQAAHSLIFEDPSRVARDVSRLIHAAPMINWKSA